MLYYYRYLDLVLAVAIRQNLLEISLPKLDSSLTLVFQQAYPETSASPASLDEGGSTIINIFRLGFKAVGGDGECRTLSLKSFAIHLLALTGLEMSRSQRPTYRITWLFV